MIEILGLLTTATVFGGIVLYSFGFAQLVFCALFGGEAGRLNRLAFSYYLFVIAAAALGGLLSVPLNPLSAALMAAIAFVGVYAHKVLLPQINSTRDSQLAGDSAGRWHFATLHRFSVALNFAQFAIAAYVLSRFPSIAR